MKTFRRSSNAMFSLACTMKEGKETQLDDEVRSSLASREGDEQDKPIPRFNSRAQGALYDFGEKEFKRMTDQEDYTIKRMTDQKDYGTIKRARSGSGSFVFSIFIQRSWNSTYPRGYPIKAPLEQRVLKSFEPSHPGNEDDSDQGKRVRPRAVSFSKESLLCSAITRDDVSEVCCLIDGGDLNPNQPNETGMTPLHRAAIDGSYHCLDFLLSRGAYVNVIDDEGWTPLHDTVFHGHVQCAKRLLVSGANVEMETNNFVKPIEMAEDEEMIVVIGRAMALTERETLPY